MAVHGPEPINRPAHLLQAPSVDLEVLAHQLEDMHGQVEEQVRAGWDER